MKKKTRDLEKTYPTAEFVAKLRRLADALENGQISGAALDVFENEPDITERLKRMDNVVLTPHIGSYTLRTRNRMAEQCAEEIRNALAGRKPGNLLNPQVWVNPDTDL